MSTDLSKLRLMIVAGEPSGDAHAAALVKALRTAAPHTKFEFFGSAGPHMREAGVDAVVRADDLAIMGIVEVTRVFSRFWKAFTALKQAALNRKPDVVVLVDWPEFNLRLAKFFHQRGIRVVYYISPQVWAWRSYRVSQIQRDVDLLLSILPFEVDWFAQRGVNHVEYVGHPLAGQVLAHCTRDEFCRKHNLDANHPVIALLPGSRHKELVRILPPLLDAAQQMARHQPSLQFVLVIAPSRTVRETEQVILDSKIETHLQVFRLVQHETIEALAAADAAAIASGTATLEAAILNTPMVIVYKESAINWHTLGRLITTEHYGLVNLVAGKPVVKELMQDECNGKSIAAELSSILEDRRNASMRSQLHEVAKRLGEGGASERAAHRVLEFLREKV